MFLNHQNMICYYQQKTELSDTSKAFLKIWGILHGNIIYSSQWNIALILTGFMQVNFFAKLN